ncbi:hypothetical protein [Actinomadura geliboluensis]|uniref:hypothetical protein n=1 Tax=Actinomadura geliboluensis TaxID=882440 RepID=UPI0036AD0B5E
MGAQNVKLAYAAYAGKVPSTAMVCLLYMALISKDSDEAPWFGQGHEALAEHALGRVPPLEVKDVRAVERAVAPLLEAGAIVADRRPAPRAGGPRTVRYRLMLPRGDAHRKAVDVEADAPRNPVDERPTVSGGDVPRKPSERPTETVQTSHENRGTEEKEEPGGENRGISQSAKVRGAVRWLRAEYGLTESEALTVWEAAQARAPEPVRDPLRYLQSMRQDPKTGEIKADLADIVAVVQDAAKPPLAAVPQPPRPKTPKPAAPTAPPPVQSPILASVKDAAEVDEKGIPAVRERADLRDHLAKINNARRTDQRAHGT